MLNACPDRLPYQQRALAQLDDLIGWIEGDLAQCRRAETAAGVAGGSGNDLHFAHGRLELLWRSREVLVAEFPDGAGERH
jgi:hypothetical protein